ncbi:ABC transporter permease [Archangium primigenium]|uniref:ABC transporter permease n=1 Tax=[Archangium] primigenium TaxID=2792470 RepID=UPI00195C2E52|nr:FtsX-like permease family protein [Archangium primigenium]MBM7116840.1 FtsX-like permease family protein [Archangium primigenium]
MRLLSMAWRQLRRDFAAGELRILLAALVLAVLAVTAIGFVTDRAERALALEANRLLGGDAVAQGDSPLGESVHEAARAPGLKKTETWELTSMIRVGDADDERLQLGELRALGEGYPLRGHFRIVRTVGGPELEAPSIPERGTVWMSRAGADALDARLGDMIGLGESQLKLAALVVQEPDTSLNAFNIAPRVLLNLADLPATGLIQEGSRLRYRLVVAGEPDAVERFVRTARAGLVRGQRLETVMDARPEMRSALERADRFLSLAALVSVVLASVAVAMAARRHSERHLSSTAVMRCLGASQRTLVATHGGELLLVGLLASSLGVLLAFGMQWVVGEWLAQTLKLNIPAAGWVPAVQGYGVGLVVLLTFGAPPILALRRVPALRVLRRDLDRTEPSAWLVGFLGVVGLAALLWWKAGSAKLALVMLLGILVTLGVLAGLAWGLIHVVRRVRSRLRGSLRYGLANVSRRAATSVAQVSALGLGLMALLLLTFVRTDLLDRWQTAIAQDAPNRFIVNLQEGQQEAVRAFMVEQGLPAPVLSPMVRARLVAHNGEPVKTVPAETPPGTTEEERSGQRRRDREYNLSSADTLREDNRITSGAFWGERRPETPEFSVEEGFAGNMGWKLGDRVAFDIAGQRLEGTVTSLREVEWESFRTNFIVLVSPGALEGYAASYITAVRVPPERTRFTAQLVARFPNLSVVEVDALLKQVRAIADQVSTVVEVVFYFSLLAGLLVLMAAVSASQDERLLEGGVMRVLGGSRRQLRLAQASEFAAIGLLSGLTASVAASVLAGVIATQVFNLPWAPDWRLVGVGGGLGVLAAVGAGLFATRRVLDTPPSVTLRELQG